MKVLVDGLFVYPGAVGGAEHMFYGLLRSLAQHRSSHRYVVAVSHGTSYKVPSLPKNFDVVEMRSTGNRFIDSEIAALGFEYDTLVCTNYYTPISAVLRRKKCFTVVHDVQFKTFPGYFSRRKRIFQSFALWFTCRFATSIVAISEFTRCQLAQFYKTQSARVSVIPNAVDWKRFAAPNCNVETLPRRLESHPFFLLAAAQYPHKNLGCAIRAFEQVKNEYPDVLLVLTGTSPSNLRGHVQESDIGFQNGLFHLGYVSDQLLGALYRECVAVLLPSLYEGFGLPAAEAIGLGARLIHSNCASLREVTEGFVTKVASPHNPTDWAESMLKCLEEDPLPEVEEQGPFARKRYGYEAVGNLWGDLLGDKD